MFSHPSPQPATRTAGKRTALVTGAARRIGRGIALALADAGFHVAITYNRSAEEAQETVRAIEARGVQGLALARDLGQVSAIRDAVAAAGKWAGACCHEQSGGQKDEANAEPSTEPRLDLLVNNAGAFETAALAKVTAEQWDSMFSTNTRAPMLVAQAALPLLQGSPQGGRIVNLGSLGGLHPWITHAHYCASKAALHMLTQTMAKAWAPQVAVNCIRSGHDRDRNRCRRGLRPLCRENAYAPQRARRGCGRAGRLSCFCLNVSHRAGDRGGWRPRALRPRAARQLARRSSAPSCALIRLPSAPPEHARQQARFALRLAAAQHGGFFV